MSGLVSRPLSLGLDDLRAMPAEEVTVTMECAGNGRARFTPRPVSQPWLAEAVGTARWRGVPLEHVVDEAGVADDAVELVFTGLDHGQERGVEQDFQRSLSVGDALESGAILAYEMNGQSLLPQHGFPLRLVVPGWYGMTNVKWLGRIEAVAEAFAGYQQAQGYRLRSDEADEGEPLTRMLPRSLLVPPGHPDFLTRERTIQIGRCVLRGRAWSGWGEIVAVEVSPDGGETWDAATLDAAGESPWAWREWTYEWTPAMPGRYELACRARDSTGREQPVDPQWNVGGYANNAVQRVPVNVV